MSVLARQSVKGTIASYAGAAIGAVNILFLFPLISKEILGLYKVLLDAALLLIVFADLGVTQSVVRYFPYFKNDENKHHGFLSQVVLITLLGFALLSLVFIAFKKYLVSFYTENSPLFADYFLWVLPITFALLFMGTFSAYAQSLMRITVPQAIREIGIRLCTSVLILLVLYKVISEETFVKGLSITHMLALCAVVAYIAILKQLHVTKVSTHFNRQRFSEMIQYGLWNLFGTGGSALILRIDTIMIASMQSLKDTGVYALAQFIGSMIEIPYRSLSKMASSRIAQLFKENDMRGIEVLYKKSSDNNFIVGGLLFLLIWFNVDALFQIIPNGETFTEGKWVVFFISAAKLIDMSLGVNAEILTNSKRYRWGLFIQAVLAVVTIALNLLLIPKYNITGAAIALFITTNLYNITRFIVIKAFFNMQPLSINTLKIFLVFGLAATVAFYFPAPANPFVSIALKSTITAIVFLLPLHFLKLSSDLETAFLKLFNK